jgi:hypothetical protein
MMYSLVFTVLDINELSYFRDNQLLAFPAGSCSLTNTPLFCIHSNAPLVFSRSCILSFGISTLSYISYRLFDIIIFETLNNPKTKKAMEY